MTSGTFTIKKPAFRIKKRSVNDTLFLAASYFMIVMTIFNGNTYLAGLSFVWLPSMLQLGMSIVKRKRLLHRQNVLAVLLFLSAAISTGRTDLELKASTYMNLQFCIAAFILVASVQLSDSLFKAIFHFYFGFGFLVSCVLIFNYIFGIGVQVFNASNVRVTIQYFGISKDVNYLSAFVLPTFAYHFYFGCLKKQKASVVKAGLVFIAMFVAGSRACFLAMMLCAVIIIAKMVFDTEHRINKPLVISAIIILGIGMYAVVSRSAIFQRTTSFENYTQNSRILIWSYALEAFFRNPLLGSGVESGSYFSQQSTKWVTHNCFIDILTGQGIVGAVIVIAMLVNILKVDKNNRIFMLCIMLCFFIPLFFVNGYECATFWMPMTLCSYLSQKCKSQRDILELL